jgi:hypothetical protein
MEYQKPCHWGNCTEWRCYECHGLLMSAGLAWCPCDGYIRWLRYPGMSNQNTKWVPDDGGGHRVTYRVAVKPSIARRHRPKKSNKIRRR